MTHKHEPNIAKSIGDPLMVENYSTPKFAKSNSLRILRNFTKFEVMYIVPT